jgi:hypothetical protein
MRLRSFLALVSLLALLCIGVGMQSTLVKADQRFPDSNMAPTAGWTGHVFQLSQDYPIALRQENYPWASIDFKKQPETYMTAILKYGVEGNDEVDWDVQKNKLRNWYHVPWLHWGRNGREFVHGLTYERVSQPLELAPTQTSTFQNWAVGIYNSPGGYAIGKVWKDPSKPDPSQAKFPEGSMSIKLLFTQANPTQVPYLVKSKEWQAYIYNAINIPTNPQEKRSITVLRLLQIDVAVKDSRSPTGWVLGTFAYNGFAPGATVWDRMIPVGLAWGSDPTVVHNGIKRPDALKEQWINSSQWVPIEHLGWGGRLNGPVDNPFSSCMSCHGTAQWPVTSPIVPPSAVIPDSKEWLRWFRDLKPNQAFDDGSQSLDFSLQLASGLQNFGEWQALTATQGGAVNTNTQVVNPLLKVKPLPTYPISRAPEEQ